MSYKRIKLSGSDPVGVVFTNGERILRGINTKYIKSVREMFTNGLISELVKEKLIPEVRIITKNIPLELTHYDCVIEHKYIEPIIYPREWSFSMYKATMKTYLEISFILHSFGYKFKDCHMFNFLFYESNPLWIDLGSFEKKDSNSNSIPILDFYTSILIPMKIWQSGGEFIARGLLSSPNRNLSLRESLILNYSIARKSSLVLRVLEILYKVHFIFLSKSRFTQRGILTKYYKITSRLKLRSTSKWKHYHNEYLNQNNEILYDSRFQEILSIMKKLEFNSFCELAGNAGVFSEIVSNEFKNIKIVCSDIDSNAVDKFYNRIRTRSLKNINCCVLDFMIDYTSSAEIESYKRFKSDCVVALAITHHLLLSQNYTYDQIFERLTKYCNKYLIIEFMPLGLWGGNEIPESPQWYSIQNFKKSFCRYFDIINHKKLEKNRIVFIGKVKN